MLQQSNIEQSSQIVTKTDVTLLNYISSAIFLAIFALLIILIKRTIAKFLSFFVFRRDYLRMRCLQQETNNDDLEDLINNKQTKVYVPNIRMMTHQEITEAFKSTLIADLIIYHPILGIVPERCVTRVSKTLRLPLFVSCTLLLCSMIISITLSFALHQAAAFAKEEQLISLLDAVATLLVSSYLAFFMSMNYMEFLRQCKYPEQAESKIRREPVERRLIGTAPSSSPGKRQVLSRGEGRKGRSGQMKTKNSSTKGQEEPIIQNTPGSLPLIIQTSTSGSQIIVQQQQNNPYLHSIKEDDEELPLSPQKHSLDDIGEDEITPGKPYYAPDSKLTQSGMLPPLGLMRTTVQQNDFHNSSQRPSFFKLQAVPNSSASSQGNKSQHVSLPSITKNQKFSNNSRFTEIADANIQQNEKLVDIDDEVIEQQQIGGSLSLSRSQHNTQRENKNLNGLESSIIYSTPGGVGIFSDVGGSVKGEAKSYQGQTTKTNKNITDITNIIGGAVPYEQQKIELKNESKFFRFAFLLIGALILVSSILSPLYVLHQLSTMSNIYVKAALLTCLYAFLIDMLVLRLIAISLISVIKTRIRLHKIKCMIKETKESISEEKLNLLGEFYEDYYVNFSTEDSSSHENEVLNSQTPCKKRFSSEDDDEERVRSASSSQGSGRRLLKQENDMPKLISRIHPTKCGAGIVILENGNQEPDFQVILSKQAVIHMTPGREQIMIDIENAGFADENLASTSNRLIGISKVTSGGRMEFLKTPGNKEMINYASPDEEGGPALKMNRPLNDFRITPLTPGQQQVYYNQTPNLHDDDIEEIELYSATKNNNISDSIVPPINITNLQSPYPSSQLEQMLTQKRSSLGQQFETPKLTPEQVQEQKSQKNVIQNVSYANNTNGKQTPMPASEGIPDKDQNASLLDQKKKLLRDLILESSSSDTKKKNIQNEKNNRNNPYQQENSREEFRSLKKYLAEDSLGSIEPEDGQKRISEAKLQVLNDSDIANLWGNNHFEKQKTDKFSPKYSSGNKSSVHMALQPIKNNKVIKQAQTAGQSSVLRGKDSVSNGYSGVGEENVGSFRQPNHNQGPRSSSHHTNLLRSVLSQNRDQENCDFSDILKQSPGERFARKSNVGGSFNSPEIKDRMTPQLESLTGSKKKKFASIIVQPERSSSPGPSLRDYEDVRVQEESEHHTKRTGKELIDLIDGSPRQAQKKDLISIVQFQSEQDQMPKEAQFEQLVQKNNSSSNNKQSLVATSSLKSSDIQSSFKSSIIHPQVSRQQSSPSPDKGYTRVHQPIKPKLPQSIIQPRNPNKDKIFMRKEDGGLQEIKESAEFLRKSQNKIYPEKTTSFKSNESQPPKQQYLSKQSQKVHPLIQDSDPIIEEHSIDLKNDQTPTPSPPKVLRQRGRPYAEEKKVLSYSVHKDNAFVGNIPKEMPEVTALRRSRMSNTAGNHSLRPASTTDDLRGSHISGEIDTLEKVEEGINRRHTSQVRTSHHNRVHTSHSITRQAHERQSPRLAESLEHKAPPPVYNQHLQQAEELRRKKNEQEINLLVMEEQRRHLKKFLQLSRQLRKGKDQKKILELLASMKETGKPLPLQAINELRMLEMMGSPYSQPLQGMIKIIEQAVLRKHLPERLQEKDTTTARQPRQPSRAESNEMMKPMSSLTSNRNIRIAKDVYAQTIQLHQINNSISRQSLSRENSAESSLGSRSKPPLRDRKSLGTNSSKESSRERGITPQLKKSSTAKKQRNRSPQPVAVEITDQSEQLNNDIGSSINPFSQIQQQRDRSDSSREGSQKRRHTSIGGKYEESKGHSRQSSTSKTTKRQKKSKKRKQKKTASTTQQQSGIASPSAKISERLRMAGLIPNPSHYSSINQVLLEHDEEESQASQRQFDREQQLETYEELTISRGDATLENADISDLEI